MDILGVISIILMLIGVSCFLYYNLNIENIPLDSIWRDVALFFLGLGVLIAGISDMANREAKIPFIIMGSIYIVITVIFTLRRIRRNKNNKGKD